MPRPLSDQVFVMTGASSGIGRCTARYVASRGARVVVTARRQDALESLVREITDAGGEAVAVPGDVTVQADLDRVAAVAVERYGRIDTWVNNAAVYLQGKVEDITVEEFRRFLDVIVLGAVRGTHVALHQMRKQGEGTIINVSSVLGKRAAPFSSPYSTSHAALDGFSQSLRAELKPTKIRVATIYAPPVDTPIYQHGRGKFGTIPKPPPPIEKPEKAARVIARMAVKPVPERTFGLFGHLFVRFSAVAPPGLMDWLMYRTGRLTISDIPDRGDNIDRPIPEDLVPATERGGWGDRGWKGVTLGEFARALPVETALVGIAATVATGAAIRYAGMRKGSNRR
jgi:NAD(P)-dependent dehydrogenase (short-subunit alcohol dehydrogenase family)